MDQPQQSAKTGKAVWIIPIVALVVLLVAGPLVASIQREREIRESTSEYFDVMTNPCH